MIKINCKTADYLNLEDITPFQGGLKIRDEEDHEKVIKSIKKHGFSVPFFIWKKGKTNYCLDGHNRIGALQRLVASGEKIPPLPVVYVKCKDEADAKELLLKINSQYGRMTKESVLEFLGDIEVNFDEIALPDTTIDFSGVVQETEETEGDDEVPEVEEKTVSKRGELYELGNSILMCGDSLNPEEVAKLLNGQSVELTFTDPPYEFSTQGGGIMKGQNRMNQAKENKVNHFDPSTLKVHSKTNVYFHNKPLIKCYIELAERYKMPYDLAFYKKLNPPPNYKGHLLTDIEYIAIIGNLSPNKGLERDEYSKCFVSKKDAENKLSYSKPVALCEKYLKLYAKDSVLDLFGGSGSTLIAAEKLGIKCYMMEHNPAMCDVIRRRYTQRAKENGKPITSGCLE